MHKIKNYWDFLDVTDSFYKKTSTTNYNPDSLLIHIDVNFSLNKICPKQ